MSSAQFIEDWNANMTYKIRNSDLERPSEMFLIKALSSLLTGLGIKDCYTLKIHSENKVESQLAKASFQKYIDRLYKIADNGNNFVYFDLIQPTPKKTFHLLQHLLNYYFFYKMMNNNLLESVSSKISERERLMTEYNNLKIKDERQKMVEESMKVKVSDYKKQIHILEKELQTLKSTAEKLMKEIDHVKTAREKVSARVKDANRMILSLEEELVDETELQKLLASKKEYEEHQTFLKEKHSSIHTRLLDTFRLKQELESMFKKFDKVTEGLNTEVARQGQSKYSNLQEALKETEEIVKRLSADIQTIISQHKSNLEQLKTSIKKNKKLLKNKKRELSKLETEKHGKENVLHSETIKVRDSEQSLEENKEILEEIIIRGEQVLTAISSNLQYFPSDIQ